MKRLAFLIIGLAVLWSAHWYWAASQKRAAIETWIEERRAAGWQISHDPVEVRGFPNRVDLRVGGLEMSSPDGLGLVIPALDILTLSYKSGHEIVVFPPEMVIETPDARWTVTSDGARASLVHDGPEIERFNLEADVLNLTRMPGNSVALAGLTAAVLRQDNATYRATLQADALARSDRMVTGSAAPQALDGFRADTLWRFDRPWRLDAAADKRPQPEHLSLRLVEYVFGALELKLAGATDVDAEGRLNGEITVKAVNWRALLDMARDAGHLPQGMARALEDGLSLIAGLSGNRETLDLPLGFDRGRMSLGPVPLGDAPRLRLP